MSSRSWLLLLGVSFCWGSVFLMTEVALEAFSPAVIAFSRIAIGAMLLWGIVIVRGLRVPRSARLFCGMAVEAFLLTSLPFTLVAWGQQQIDSGLSGVLNATTAIFATLLAALLFKDERLTTAKACGVAVGFCGVVVVIGFESLQQLDATSLAQYAILASAVCYAFGGASGKILMLEGSCSPVVHAASMTTCGAFLLLPFVASQPDVLQAFSTVDLRATAAVLWLSAVSTAVAYLLYSQYFARGRRCQPFAVHSDYCADCHRPRCDLFGRGAHPSGLGRLCADRLRARAYRRQAGAHCR